MCDLEVGQETAAVDQEPPFSASADAASRRRCAAEEARLALRVAAGGFAGEVKRGGR